MPDQPAAEKKSAAHPHQMDQRTGVRTTKPPKEGEAPPRPAHEQHAVPTSEVVPPEMQTKPVGVPPEGSADRKQWDDGVNLKKEGKDLPEKASDQTKAGFNSVSVPAKK